MRFRNTSFDQAARVKARWIPKDALPVTEDPTLGVVYVYPWVKGDMKRYGAVAYSGTAQKSDWHYICKTDAELDKKIAEYFKLLRDHKERVKARRKESYAGHQLVIGDILTYSWGYDQTNVDWFRVTRTTQNFVWLQPIAAEMIYDEGCGPMSGKETIKLDEHLKPIDLDKPETKHKAEKLTVYMAHGCASKWTGDKQYVSWYH